MEVPLQAGYDPLHDLITSFTYLYSDVTWALFTTKRQDAKDSENIPFLRLLVITFMAEINPPTFLSLHLHSQPPLPRKWTWIFWDVIQPLSCLKLDCFAWGYLFIVLESKLPAGWISFAVIRLELN